MELRRMLMIICFLLVFSSNQSWGKNLLNSDLNYNITIAVTINEDDHIMGSLEYSNQAPQFPLQLVAFNSIGGIIHSFPYVFELVQRTIITENVHQVKFRSINDKYGGGLIIGTIDFRNESQPKVKLVNEGGNTYISNLTKKGKEIHKKYIPNVRLGLGE